MSNSNYAYVIVGAGSVGCTLAHRLRADGDARVLLLEAGGWKRDPLIHIPLAWGRIAPRPTYRSDAEIACVYSRHCNHGS